MAYNGKKTNIKIKKSKYNLYNKKKSKSRQALTLAITIVAACALGVVGYGVGKPIVNYFQTRDNPPVVESDSSSYVSEQSSSVVSSSDRESSSETSSVPEPVVSTKDLKLCVLSEQAVSSTASLNGALAAARESGYETVAVTLKDEQGFLYYSSDIERVKGTELVKGTLSAAQICDYITKAGMTPAVRISTLKDSNTPIRFGGYKFADGGGWLDDYPDAGGKRWLSPFTEEAAAYIGELTSELSEAGFKHIICANTMYPNFHNVDADQYLKHLPIRQRDARLDALWNVADAAIEGAKAGKAQLWFEFKGDDLLAAEKFGTEAELAARPEKLGDIGIIADYTMGSAEGVFDAALEFSNKLKAAAGDNELAVLIKSGPSEGAIADIERAFEQAEIQTFREK